MIALDSTRQMNPACGNFTCEDIYRGPRDKKRHQHAKFPNDPSDAAQIYKDANHGDRDKGYREENSHRTHRTQEQSESDYEVAGKLISQRPKRTVPCLRVWSPNERRADVPSASLDHHGIA